MQLGLVASLNRPGGNVTGMSAFSLRLTAKSIELLKELIPAARATAILFNPVNPSGELMSREAHTTANVLGLQLHVINASTERELDDAFESIVRMPIDGLAVSGEPFFDSRRERIVALAARYSLPTIYAWRANVVIGGLMSYGTSLPDFLPASGDLCRPDFSREKSPPIFPCNNRPNLNWSSI